MSVIRENFYSPNFFIKDLQSDIMVEPFNIKDYNVGDLVGLKFSYFLKQHHKDKTREIHGILLESDVREGWKVLITYDSHGRALGTHGHYSSSWLANASKGEKVWKISEGMEGK